ncbi:MAG: FRG domain-containing protein, partial [Bacteroidales bacterium]
MARPVNQVRVSTWNELNECLFEASWKRDLRRFRSSYAFRGQSNAAGDLKTSLARLALNVDVEEHLLRNFRKYAHREAVPGDSVWNWLAVAQHHGLPTRLLDWTYSPYVAMHFATQDLADYRADGVIWCVDYTQTNTLLPDRLKRLLREEGSFVFTAEMLERAAATLQKFDRLSKKTFVVFFEPPSLDERIIVQFALFSLVSNYKLSLDARLANYPHVYRKVIIPAALKWEVR